MQEGLTVGRDRPFRFDADLAREELSPLKVAESQVGDAQLEVDAFADDRATGIIDFNHDRTRTAVGASVDAEGYQALRIGELGAAGG